MSPLWTPISRFWRMFRNLTRWTAICRFPPRRPCLRFLRARILCICICVRWDVSPCSSRMKSSSWPVAFRTTVTADAAFRLVSSHLRLVVKIAMDFQRRWMQNVLDLIQEGNVGLMRAVNKFDPDKGIKFSYYAAFWIRAYILKFIMDNWRMVKIGTTQAQRKLFYNLNRERQKLIAEGFDPDASVLASRLGVGEDQIVEMQQRLDASDMSLDATVNDEAGSATRMDFLPALGPGIEESIAGREIAELLHDHLREICPPSRKRSSTFWSTGC